MRGFGCELMASAALVLACGDSGGVTSATGTETGTTAMSSDGSTAGPTGGDDDGSAEASSGGTTSSGDGSGTAGETGTSTTGSVKSGSFSLLTYNVAGLPEGLSKSSPFCLPYTVRW